MVYYSVIKENTLYCVGIAVKFVGILTLQTRALKYVKLLSSHLESLVAQYSIEGNLVFEGKVDSIALRQSHNILPKIF